MKICKDIVIVLTATINPNGMINTILQDPIERERQYIEAINFYLRETSCRIIFCENTKYNIDNIQSKYDKNEQIEFISFKGNDNHKEFGKGYGEAKIIDKILTKSKFIIDSKFIIKITGRLKIRNIKNIVKTARQYQKITKYFFAGEIKFQNWIRSECFIIDKKSLQVFISQYGQTIKDYGICFENMLYNGITENPHIKIKLIYPFIIGISGTSGKNYINIPLSQRKLDANLALQNFYNQNKDTESDLLLLKIQYLRVIRKFSEFICVKNKINSY